MAPTTTNIAQDPKVLLNTFIDRRSIQLVSVLGVGAYGVVYLGVHVPTSRRYAVKLLNNPKAAETEITLHSRVSSHKGVLTLEKVVRENNQVYLVLEYATGGDLFSAITQQQGIASNNFAIRHIFTQILDAVQYCHQQGIAHRDLKPENILMFSNLQAKLADFGLATTQLVSAEFGCGSSFYFSPECQGQLVKNKERIKGYSTRQNDVWSLGVILINLTAGRNPWRQATMKDQAFASYVKKPQTFFKRILPCISDELNDLLLRIFCLDPARRISLPELRLRIQYIRSFTATTEKKNASIPPRVIAKLPVQVDEDNTKPRRSSAPTTISFTKSLVHTLCDYSNGFSDDTYDNSFIDEDDEDDDDEEETAVVRRAYVVKSPYPAPTTHLPSTPPAACFSTSPCSSASSFDYPSTPRASPAELNKKSAIDVDALNNLASYTSF
ncbi:protein serine threonine kinase [Lichtheimia corymbifera JMRC:FSU:9682]|uniref:Protein serine threonine kinase n=1 Tax=Lichtheimia corymbifera JMRC:FSU:9682 TaxID=1263082 RepID=A0A068RVN0_9FUNG|nr:protein serine threonine kinase [Lichtheimia corymbifera JMRC:FSU:9682]